MSTGEPLVQEKAADASSPAAVVRTNTPVSTPKPDNRLALAVPKSIVVSASAAQPVTITFSARSGQGLIFWEKSDWIKYKQTLLEEQGKAPASEPVWFPCFALPASNGSEAASPLVHYKFVYDFKVTAAK